MKDDFTCLQFIDAYYPVIDGVVNAVHNYATHLNKPDVTCVVVAPKFKDHDDNFLYDVIRTKGFKVPFMQYVYGTPIFDPETYDTVLDMHPDILHAHSPFEVGKFALRVGEKLNIPVIGTFHTKYYDDFKAVLKSDSIAQLLTDTVVHFYEKCDYVWTMNNATANTIKSYGYKGDVSIIPNGADMLYYDRALELREKAILKYRLPRDKKLILFVGQITWKKNLKVLIDVISHLKDIRNDFLMLFIGGSYQEDEVEEYAKAHAPEHTMFLGQISDREMLAGAYAASSLLFFPSLYDTASLVVREAAQMHVPSLLIKGSDASEGVINRYNGFLALNDEYALTKVLNDILDNPDMLKHAGDMASTTLPITWEQVTDIVLSEYRRITAQSNKPKQRRILVDYTLDH